jgi:hypothetical protein
MKRRQILFACIALSSILTLHSSCNKKESNEPTQEQSNLTIITNTITSLDATNKKYLNLTSGEFISADVINATNWDISFYAKDRSIVIAVNSGTEGSGTAGAQIVSSSFEELKNAPESGYLTGSEATGDYLKWANYTGSTTDPKHAILPKPGHIFAIKTADGKYAKIQMISLYEGNPSITSPEFIDYTKRSKFGYFTFKYAIQKNGTNTF